MLAEEQLLQAQRLSQQWLVRWLIIMCGLLLACQVLAAKYPELNKQELSEVRGKYVSSNQVAYFGITMHTLWKMSAGTHRVGFRMEADLRQGQPRLRFHHGGTLGEQQQENTSLPEPPAALGQVEGAVQAIQIASHNNRVHNNLSIAVSEQGNTAVMDSGVTGDTGNAAAETMPTLTSTPVQMPQVQTYVSSETGATTQFNTDGSVGYSIATDTGLVVQRIGGPEMARQLIQAVQVGRDTNTIINDVKLRIEFNQGQNLRNDVRRLNRSLLGLQ